MSKSAIALMLCLFSSFLGAKVSVPDTDYSSIWRDYAKVDTDRQPKQIFPYHDCFERAAATHDVPLTLLLAVARGESDFKPSARSKANAYGLMQILWPTTAHHLNIRSLNELKKPCVNVDAGARYLKEMLGIFDGDFHLALAAYNYGPQRIQRSRYSIPKGANWYSGYIHQHLQYVLGQKGSNDGFTPPANYSVEKKLELLVFNESYRATAFMLAIEKRVPQVRLEIFNKGMGRYHVVLLYGSQQELDNSKGALEQAGIL